MVHLWYIYLYLLLDSVDSSVEPKIASLKSSSPILGIYIFLHQIIS